MNPNDGIDLEQLRRELLSAKCSADEMQTRFWRSRKEIQFYQGLLWSLLACGVAAAIASLLSP